MSHRQAYHTSCRSGLEGRSGFQFNAASDGIEPAMLALLAAAHAGYQAPRDCPREPTAEQLRAFPVTLKSRAVDGVPVVSQTVYVGREFRGRDGEPDSGRFGNYFSHIVLADPSASEPFDGLLPIELWRAPHWRSAESQTPQLPRLGALEPGRCDVEWALEQLAPRRAWLQAALDAALSALEGGPRVVLVEPDVERAAAWVAWVSYALPAELAAALTFTTFSGQPRHALDVQLCVTTPGCDVAFAEHELAREVTLLDVAGERQPPTARLLYARVAGALAADGPEAFTAALRTPSDGSAARRGAQLAIASERVELALEQHVPSLLELVEELARGGRWERALATAAALPADAGDGATLQAWSLVHRSARAATAEQARDLADAALARLIDHIADAPEQLEPVSAENPTSPSPATLARWLEQVERAEGARRAALLSGGLRLGLIGNNVALDRRVAATIGEAIEDEQVAALLSSLAGDPRYAALVEQTVAGLARDAFADERALPRLRRAIADPALAATTRLLAARAEEFDERAVWERLRVEADPRSIADALFTLVPIAARAGRGCEVKTLFASGRPDGVAEHTLLLRAFAGAGATACEEDVDTALAALAEVPLAEDEQAFRLIGALRTVTPVERLRDEPLFSAWQAVGNQPPAAGFAEWCGWVARAAIAAPAQVPDERWQELRELAVAIAVQALDFDEMLRGRGRGRGRGEARAGLAPRAPRRADPMDEYIDGLQSLAESFAKHWAPSVCAELERRLGKGRDRAWFGMRAFVVFEELPAGTGELLERALAPVIEQLSQRRLQAIEERLEGRKLRDWQLWLERHPPRPGVGETVSRLLRREGR